MKTKNWRRENEIGFLVVLRGLGVESISQLKGCSLIVHVSYESDGKSGGKSFYRCIESVQIEFSREMLNFRFEDSPIVMDFDPVSPGPRLKGDFEELEPRMSEIKILNLRLLDGKWCAHYELTADETIFGDISDEQLRVELIRP